MVAPTEQESRICGVVPIGETKSVWVGHTVGQALGHMIARGETTVFLRVDVTDEGDYRIIYSPDRNDIPVRDP